MANKFSFDWKDSQGNPFTDTGNNPFAQGTGNSPAPSVDFEKLSDEEKDVYAEKYHELFTVQGLDEDQARLGAEESLFTWRSKQETPALNPIRLPFGLGEIVWPFGGGQKAWNSSMDFESLADSDKDLYADAYMKVLNQDKSNIREAVQAGEQAVRDARVGTPTEQLWQRDLEKAFGGEMQYYDALDDETKKRLRETWDYAENPFRELNTMVNGNGMNKAGVKYSGMPKAGDTGENPGGKMSLQEYFKEYGPDVVEFDQITDEAKAVMQEKYETEGGVALEEWIAQQNWYDENLPNYLVKTGEAAAPEAAAEEAPAGTDYYAIIGDTKENIERRDNALRVYGLSGYDGVSREEGNRLADLMEAGDYARADALALEYVTRKFNEAYGYLDKAADLDQDTLDEIEYLHGMIEQGRGGEITNGAARLNAASNQIMDDAIPTVTAVDDKPKNEKSFWENFLDVLGMQSQATVAVGQTAAPVLQDTAGFLTNLPERGKDLQAFGASLWAGMTQITTSTVSAISRFLSGELMSGWLGMGGQGVWNLDETGYMQGMRATTAQAQQRAQALQQDMTARLTDELLPVMIGYGISEEDAKNGISLLAEVISGVGYNLGHMSYDLLLGMMSGGVGAAASMQTAMYDVAANGMANAAAMAGTSLLREMGAGIKACVSNPSFMPLALGQLGMNVDQMIADKGEGNLTTADYWYCLGDAVLNSMIELGGDDAAGGLEGLYSGKLDHEGFWKRQLKTAFGEVTEENAQNIEQRVLDNWRDVANGKNPEHALFSVDDVNAVISLADMMDTSVMTFWQTLGSGVIHEGIDIGMKGYSTAVNKLKSGEQMTPQERAAVMQLMETVKNMEDSEAAFDENAAAQSDLTVEEQEELFVNSLGPADDAAALTQEAEGPAAELAAEAPAEAPAEARELTPEERQNELNNRAWEIVNNGANGVAMDAAQEHDSGISTREVLDYMRRQEDEQTRERRARELAEIADDPEAVNAYMARVAEVIKATGDYRAQQDAALRAALAGQQAEGGSLDVTMQAVQQAFGLPAMQAATAEDVQALVEAQAQAEAEAVTEENADLSAALSEEEAAPVMTRAETDEELAARKARQRSGMQPQAGMPDAYQRTMTEAAETLEEAPADAGEQADELDRQADDLSTRADALAMMPGVDPAQVDALRAQAEEYHRQAEDIREGEAEDTQAEEPVMTRAETDEELGRRKARERGEQPAADMPDAYQRTMTEETAENTQAGAGKKKGYRKAHSKAADYLRGIARQKREWSHDEAAAASLEARADELEQSLPQGEPDEETRAMIREADSLEIEAGEAEQNGIWAVGDEARAIEEKAAGLRARAQEIWDRIKEKAREEQASVTESAESNERTQGDTRPDEQTGPSLRMEEDESAPTETGEIGQEEPADAGRTTVTDLNMRGAGDARPGEMDAQAMTEETDTSGEAEARELPQEEPADAGRTTVTDLSMRGAGDARPGEQDTAAAAESTDASAPADTRAMEAEDQARALPAEAAGQQTQMTRQETQTRQQRDGQAVAKKYGFNSTSNGVRAGVNINSWDGTSMSTGYAAEMVNLDRWIKDKKHNVSVVLDSTLEGGKANGTYSYTDKDGHYVIHIAQDAENPTRTVFGHELYHLIEANNSEGARIIRETFEEYAQRAGLDLDQLEKEKAQAYRNAGIAVPSHEVLREELVADSLYDIIGDENTVRAIAAQSRTTVERIRAFIDRLLQEIREMLQAYTDRDPGARMLRDTEGAMERMRALVDQALNDIDEVEESRRAVRSLGSNGETTRQYQEDVSKAADRRTLNRKTDGLARSILRQTDSALVTDEKVYRLKHAALDFVAGGGTVSQALKDYGLKPWAGTDAEMNRAFAILGKYMLSLTQTDGVTFYQAMEGEPAGEAQFSLKDMQKLSWKQQMDRYYKKNGLSTKSNDVFEMAKAGDLKEFGIDAPVIVKQSALTKSTKEENPDVSSSAHGLEESVIYSLSDAIKDPAAVIKTDRGYVFVTELDHKKDDKLLPVVVPMVRGTFEGKPVFNVPTIYGRPDMPTLYGEYIGERFIARPNVQIKTYKENSTEILTRQVANRGHSQEINEVLRSIIEKSKNVKYSIKTNFTETEETDKNLPESLPDIYARQNQINKELREKEKALREYSSSPELRELIREMNRDKTGDMDQYLGRMKEMEEKAGVAGLRDQIEELKDQKDRLTKQEEAIRHNQLADDIRKSGKTQETYFLDKAVKEFGYTPYFYDAGYITPDGKMLNFSGEKGKHYGTRGQDHRAISTIYEGTLGGTEALNAFVNDGNVRIMDEAPGIDVAIGKELTDAQKITITKHINSHQRDGYSVDYTGPDGRTVASADYEPGVRPSRVLADIEDTQRNGAARERSIVADFHGRYSLKTVTPQQDAEYMEAVESGDREKQQQMVDRAAERAGCSTEKAYHGSESFGFTEFDMERSQGEIFVAYNEDISRTYGRNLKTRDIADKPVNYQAMSQREIADELEKRTHNKVTYYATPGEYREELYREAKEALDNLPKEKALGIRKNDLADELRPYVDALLAKDLTDPEYIKQYDALYDKLTAMNDARNKTWRELGYGDVDDTLNGIFGVIGDGAAILDSGIKEYYVIHGEDDMERPSYKHYNRNSANEYLNRQNGRKKSSGIYTFYTRPGRQLVVDAKGSNWNRIHPEWDKSGKDWKTREIAEYARRNGYDSVRINDVYDHGGYWGDKEAGHGDIGIFFDNRDVKSADPVTYDDAGNVIPLSERFDAGNEDIRWSVKDTRTVRQLTDALEEAAVSAGNAEETREMIWALADRLLEENGVSREQRPQLIGAAFAGAATGDMNAELETVGLKLNAAKEETQRAMRVMGEKANDLIAATEGEAYESLFAEPGEEEEQAAAEEAPAAEPEKKEKKPRVSKKARDTADVKAAWDTKVDYAGTDQNSHSLMNEIVQMIYRIRSKATMDEDGRLTYQGGHWKKGLNTLAAAVKDSLYGVSLSEATIAKHLQKVYEMVDEYMQDERFDPEQAMLYAVDMARRMLTEDYIAGQNKNGELGQLRQEQLDTLREKIGTLGLGPDEVSAIKNSMGMQEFRRVMRGVIDVRTVKKGEHAYQALEETYEEAARILGMKDAEGTWNPGDMVENLYDYVRKIKTPDGRATLQTEEERYLDQLALNLAASYFTVGDNAVTTETLHVIDDKQHAEAVRRADELEKQVSRQQDEIVQKQQEIEKAQENYQLVFGQLRRTSEELRKLRESGGDPAQIAEARQAMRDALAKDTEARKEIKALEKKLKEQQKKQDERKEKLRQTQKELRAQTEQTEKEQRRAERLGRQLEKLNEKLAEQKKKVQKERQDARANRERYKAIEDIRALGGEIKKMMTRPGKKNGFVTRNHMRDVAEFVDALTRNDGRKSAAAGKKLQAAIREARLSSDYNTSALFSDELSNLMDEAVRLLEDKGALRNLTKDELTIIQRATAGVIHQMKYENAFLSEQLKKEVQDAAAETIQVQNRIHKKTKGFGAGLNAALLAHLSPERVGNELSHHEDNAVSRAFQALIEGWRKKGMLAMKATKLFEPLTKGKSEKQFAQFTGKKAVWHDTGIRALDQDGKETGETFRMTGAMLASFFLNWTYDENREAMETSKGSGLYQLSMPDEKLLAKGKTKEAYQMGRRMYFKAEQAAEILDQVTDYQKAWAKAWQEAEETIFRSSINDTSMKLKGYRVAGVKDYFPILRDPSFIGGDFESVVMDNRIAEQGWTKERVKAHNPMMLMDITDIINRQIDGVSSYVGMAVPIRDFTMLYNANMPDYADSVKKAINRAHGTSMTRYIEDLMGDLNGANRAQNSFLDSLRGKQAAAVLTGNPGVVIKQAASYPAAAAVVGWKALNKAIGYFATPRRIDTDLIDTYTSGHWERRSQRMSDLEANASRSNPVSKGLHWLGNGIQGMDVLTTKVLWKAAENYVSDTTDVKPGDEAGVKAGTDAYYQEVAKVYERILEQSQPEYGTMQRPGILRSKSQIVKSMTMFKTQAMQNFNILADSFANLADMKENLKANDTKENRKAVADARTQVARAVSSQIVSAITLGVMTALGKALMHKLRDYRDDKGDLTPESIGAQIMKDSVSSMAGMVAGGSELFDLINGLIEGQAPWDIEAAGISTINDLYQNTFGLINEAIQLGDSSLSVEQKAQKIGKAARKYGMSVAQLLGFPLNNVVNLVDGIVANVKDFVMGKGLSFEESGVLGAAQGRETSNADVAGYIAQAMASGDEQEAMRLYNEQLRQGKTPESVNNAIAAWQKENIAEIRQAAEAIDRGDVTEYNRLINEIVKQGVSMANAVKYVESMRKKIGASDTGSAAAAGGQQKPITYAEMLAMQTSESTEKTYGSGYTTGMMNSLLEDGNVEGAISAKNAMLASGKQQSSINSALSSYWKPILQQAYSEGDMVTVRRITDMLVQMGVKRATITGWTGGSSSSGGSVFGKSSFKSGSFGKGGSFGTSSFGSNAFSSKKKKNGWF